MNFDTKLTEAKMQKSIAAYSENLATIRAGRANASVLSKVTVDYYGVATPINQVAEVKASDARTLMIQPWDASTLKNIEKAILASDVGITPQNDGKIIRLTFPQLTEERRREIIKQIAKHGEEAKVAIRSTRRDAIERFKKQKKNKEITEDDLSDLEEQIQKLTDKFVKQIDKIISEKEKEILEV